jgi:short-subunit dehydrogenase
LIKNPFKNVLITGASRGIGKALANEYASRGANLVLLARDENALKVISTELSKSKIKTLCTKCDVSDREQMAKAIKFALDSMGTIDGAVLNAGISIRNWIEYFNADDFRKTIEVNLFSIAHGLELLVPIMKKQGYGTIAGVSSLADARGYPGSAAYTASKAAVTRLLESARVELKKNNINVITVKPGFVRTDMTAKNEFMMPFMVEPEKAARIIKRGIERNMKVISFPLGTVLLTKISAHLPNFIYDPLMRKLRPQTE